MNLGDIIKKFRDENDLSMQDLADKLGTTRSYVHMLEHNKNPRTNRPVNPSIETLKALSKVMNIDVEDLLKLMDSEQSIILSEDIFNKQFSPSAIPLLGIVKAGYDLIADENLLGYVETDLKSTEDYFALKVRGDSMSPILHEDDIVIVHQQPDIESGQVAVILVGNEATIKKVIKHDGYIELVAFNSYYPPKKVEKDFKIVGRVIEARIKKIFE